MKVEITKAQLEAIKRMADDTSSYVGGGEGEWDKEAKHNVTLVDRFLEKNGFKRKFK